MSKKGNPKLTVEQVEEIREYVRNGQYRPHSVELAKMYGVSVNTVGNVTKERSGE